ncbi:Tat pathway signal protein [Segnochrobactrum spirostomi]|uniref:Tat pathway signal protein n=1 Tax=Segnochrobactrum spirostomi TaxID=2608987 RepID=A0A6A7Y6T0_9HYPH|nr:Tat pathway signal protein [Segnochrobactrum spirostomi]MQT14017.1 Tat pathway signal protein [Segnochrobactrum spirostomi]
MRRKEPRDHRHPQHRPMRHGATLLASAWWIATAALAPDSALATEAQTAPVRIELNKLEAQPNGCRVYFLIENAKGPAIKTLKLDLFVMGRDGVVEKRLAVETAPIAASKTIVKLFDLAGVPCDRVGKVLLNDVMTCDEAAQAPAGICLDRVQTASRAPEVPFVR